MDAVPQHRRHRSARAARWRLGQVAWLIIFLAVPAPALAQQSTGRIAGRVVDAETGEPLPGAQIDLQSGMRIVASATAEDDGQFIFTGIPAGRYSLIFSSIGHETLRRDAIRVPPEGGIVNVGGVELVSRALLLNPVVVTASREQEKTLDAPASVYTVTSDEIEEQPTTTPADHVRGLPGADVVSTGISQHNIVARGFNNVFSGALFVLTDNRWASVPSLRFNAYNMIPVTNEDIDRIEFVLGPGSALYGPNVDKGVFHIITRSPLDHQETTVSLTGGEREIFQGSLRHAGLLSDNVGYKISGQYSRGRDWVFRDPAEQIPGISRDFDQERYYGDLRLDFQLDDQSTLILNGGATRMASSIEMTGIGAAQALDWTYSYAQARFRRNRLFVQSYLNLSDAGDSFTLRDADTISDNSLLYVGQVQHGASIGERQDFTYGVDFIRTIPRTDGEINGRNEEDDNITEVGGYLQSETRLSPMFDLVLAARADYHSEVDDVVFSPRAAIVFKPRQEHSLRLTYNRAFSQPTSNNLFLDKLSAPSLGGLPYPIRGRGAPSEGFTFSRDCTNTVGQDGLCMRTPFLPPAAGGPSAQLPMDISVLWPVIVGGVCSQDPNAAACQLLQLMEAPAVDQVGLYLANLNPGRVGVPGESPFDLVQDVTDVPQTTSQITTTIEAGYKGLIADRLLLGIDGYYSHIEDFIGPLLVETPNVFVDGISLGSYLASECGRLGVCTIDQATALAGTIAQVPWGIVTPDQVDSQIQNGLDPTTIILTYRNFPSFDLWGADVGATLLLTDWLRLSGSYSFVSERFFSAEEIDAPADLALNSPQNKASLGAHVEIPRRGLRGEIRGRYVDSFPVISGVYVGHVENYTVFDALVSYSLLFSRTTEITLSVTNVFDNRHQQMVGAPDLGRLVLLRLRQTF